MRTPAPDPDTAATSRRGEVLHALQRIEQPRTSAEIADELGVHKNTVRFHLDSLSEAGLVERTTRPAVGPGRPAQAYSAVRSMDPTGPRHFRELAAVLTQALSSHPDGAELALEAGRQWGARVAATSADPIESVNESLDALVQLLHDFGFAPERGEEQTDRPSRTPAPGTDQGERRLLPVVSAHRCPFLELAEEHQRIVCPVHLGLMRGAMEAWGSPVHVEALEPFNEPDHCLVQLSTTKQGE